MAKKAPTFFDYILKRTLLVESAANGVGQELTSVLEESLNNVKVKLENYKGDRTFTKTYFERAQIELTGTIKELDKKYNNIISDSTKKMVDSEYDSVTRKLRGSAGKELKESNYTIPLETVQNFLSEPMGGDFLENYIQNHLSSVQRTIRQTMATAITLNETVQQAANRLRIIDGIGNKGANMIARTVFNHSSNATRLKSYEENSDLIKKYRFVATLDSRTTLICATTDGNTYNRLKDVPQPPLHPSCRSTVIPLTALDLALEEDGTFEDTRPAVVNQKAKTVKHRDGTTSTKFTEKEVEQLPSGTTFKDFFERQPETWKKSYLGKSRYELYKSGNIEFKDLAKNNQVVGLDQLKTKAEKTTTPPLKSIFGKRSDVPIKEKELVDNFKLDLTESELNNATKNWNKDFKIPPNNFINGVKNSIPEELELEDLYVTIPTREEKKRTYNFDFIFRGKNKELIRLTRGFDFKEGEKIVKHSFFKLSPDLRNKGLAKKVLNDWLDLYEEIGIQKIDINANIDVGGYAWARYGFTPTKDFWKTYKNDLLEKLEIMWKDIIPENEFNYLSNLMKEDNPKNIWKIADSKLGKDLLYNESWEGEFNFNDAEQFNRLKKYINWKSKK